MLRTARRLLDEERDRSAVTVGSLESTGSDVDVDDLLLRINNLERQGVMYANDILRAHEESHTLNTSLILLSTQVQDIVTATATETSVRYPPLNHSFTHAEIKAPLMVTNTVLAKGAKTRTFNKTFGIRTGRKVADLELLRYPGRALGDISDNVWGPLFDPVVRPVVKAIQYVTTTVPRTYTVPVSVFNNLEQIGTGRLVLHFDFNHVTEKTGTSLPYKTWGGAGSLVSTLNDIYGIIDAASSVMAAVVTRGTGNEAIGDMADVISELADTSMIGQITGDVWPDARDNMTSITPTHATMTACATVDEGGGKDGSLYAELVATQRSIRRAREVHSGVRTNGWPPVSDRENTKGEMSGETLVPVAGITLLGTGYEGEIGSYWHSITETEIFRDDTEWESTDPILRPNGILTYEDDLGDVVRDALIIYVNGTGYEFAADPGTGWVVNDTNLLFAANLYLSTAIP
jgi:hypothetical protein